jgi:small subunit ribosomal protein S9
MMDSMDVEAKVTGGGTTGQSGAIRWGISWALRSFVDDDVLKKMKVGKYFVLIFVFCKIQV